MNACFERQGTQAMAHPVSTVLIVAMMLFGAPASHAAAYMDVTRVILAGVAPEANPQITNSGKTPALFQTWIDANRAGSGAVAAPADTNVPFIIDPPLFRLEPRRSKRLRIFADGAAATLPKDRESVFWLNVLEVPPHTLSANQNSVQFAFHTRIKLFYRPSGISPSAEGSFEQMVFKLTTCPGDIPKLIVRNPTAYHQTLLGMAVTPANAAAPTQPQALRVELPSEGMLAPLSQSEHAMPLLNGPEDLRRSRVDYTYINDFGAVVDMHRGLEIEEACPSGENAEAFGTTSTVGR